MIEASLFVPYRTPRRLHEIHEQARVVVESAATTAPGSALRENDPRFAPGAHVTL